MTDTEATNLLRPYVHRIAATLRAQSAGEHPYAPVVQAFSGGVSELTIDDAAKFADYFAADDDGHFPGHLHSFFGCSPKLFADRTGLVKKQITDKNGHRVWHWVRRQIAGSPAPQQAPPAPQPAPAHEPAAPTTALQPVAGANAKAGKLAQVKAAAVAKLSQTKGGRVALALGGASWKVFHALEHRAMFVAKKVQAIAATAVEERGFPPERTEKLKHALYAADFLGGYATGAAAVAAGAPAPVVKGVMLMPSASVVYLAYSTAVNPKATLRAAKRVLAETFAKDGAGAAHHADGIDLETLGPTVADALKAAPDPDLWVAVFTLALGTTKGDTKQALDLTNRAFDVSNEDGDGIEMSADEFCAMLAEDAEENTVTFGTAPKKQKVMKVITVKQANGKTHKERRLVNADIAQAAKPTKKAAPAPAAKPAPEPEPAKETPKIAEPEPATKPKAEPKPKTKAEPKPKTAARVPEKKMSDKAVIAAKNAVRVDKVIQRYAEEYNEPRIARLLGGAALPDSEACDVKVPLAEADRETWVRAMDEYRTAMATWTEGGGKGARPVMAKLAGVAGALVELKTLTVGQNDKLTMDKYAQARKVVAEREAGAPYHTVACDDRQVIDLETGQPGDESKRVYYYRRGIAGSARIGTMHRCEGEEELKRLMALPEEELPPAARRTDAHMTDGEWVYFEDAAGKGYRNTKTGDIARPKK